MEPSKGSNLANGAHAAGAEVKPIHPNQPQFEKQLPEAVASSVSSLGFKIVPKVISIFCVKHEKKMYGNFFF